MQRVIREIVVSRLMYQAFIFQFRLEQELQMLTWRIRWCSVRSSSGWWKSVYKEWEALCTLEKRLRVLVAFERLNLLHHVDQFTKKLKWEGLVINLAGGGTWKENRSLSRSSSLNEQRMKVEWRGREKETLNGETDSATTDLRKYN